jgi:hypothetical protein
MDVCFLVSIWMPESAMHDAANRNNRMQRVVGVCRHQRQRVGISLNSASESSESTATFCSLGPRPICSERLLSWFRFDSRLGRPFVLQRKCHRPETEPQRDQTTG